MKKIILTIFILMLSISLISCNKINDNEEVLSIKKELGSDTDLWKNENFPKPDGCKIIKTNEIDEGILYQVEWDSKESAVKYSEKVMELEEDKNVYGLNDLDDSYVFNSYHVHISYHKTANLNNIRIYNR